MLLNTIDEMTAIMYSLSFVILPISFIFGLIIILSFSETEGELKLFTIKNTMLDKLVSYIVSLLVCTGLVYMFIICLPSIIYFLVYTLTHHVFETVLVLLTLWMINYIIRTKKEYTNNKENDEIRKLVLQFNEKSNN